MKRKCKACLCKKDISEFYEWKSGDAGLCKPCHRAKRKEYYVKNKPAILELQKIANKRRASKDPDANKRRVRNNRIRSRYGVGSSWYDDRLLEQGGVCKICKSPPSTSDPFAKLCIDHNHSTGSPRDLLCRMCNIAVGAVRESVSLSFAVASYLDRHNGVDSWTKELKTLELEQAWNKEADAPVVDSVDESGEPSQPEAI